MKTFFSQLQQHALLIIILIVAFMLRLYMIQADPFLHDWDERFHALVAKNMIEDPFYPVLYKKPLIPFDPSSWCCNQVWLHKQPLFLWQMALSMRLFGVSEWALRIPSLIMGTLSVLLVYRLALLATKQRTAAFIAAIIMSFCCYQLNLISGREGMDHNDVAFTFYVLASFWAAAEYLSKGGLKWAILMGLFAGCAILNKWMTGLLVFLPIGLLLFSAVWGKKSQKGSIVPVHFLLALLTCVVVFMPWQLYIFHRFPVEARIEFAANTRHIFEVVEGHKGNYDYYLSHFNRYFGDVIEILVIPALLYFGYSKKIQSNYKVLLIVPVLAVFVFFSFIVKTKISGFFFVVYPMIIIMIAFLMDELLSVTGRIKKVLLLPTILCLAYWSLNPIRITDYNGDKNFRETKCRNTVVYKHLHAILPPGIKVISNTPEFDHVDVMFYNPSVSAYSWFLTKEEFEMLAAKNTPIAVFKGRPGSALPDYLKNYKHLFIIPDDLR